MPILHQLNVNTTFLNVSALSLVANTPIAIIGIAEGGTVPLNTITQIKSDADLSRFGAAGVDNTLLPNIRILQEYGCNNIYAIRVAKGATAADTETNILGTDPASGIRTGLHLFKDTFSLFRVRPQLLLVPGYSSDAIVTRSIDVCNNLDAFVLLDFALGTTTAQATTIRTAATGLGQKNARLVPCMPYVKRGATFEPLSVHLAGVIASTTYLRGYGFTPSNELLISAITGIESGFTLSYTDVNADNQRLERLGITTLNLHPNGYVIWGNRNALYVENSVETGDTFFVIQRIKQVLNDQFSLTSVLFLDEISNYSTAKLLENALNNIISINNAQANLNSMSRSVLDEINTNYNQRNLFYTTTLIPNLPVSAITLNTQVTLRA